MFGRNAVHLVGTGRFVLSSESFGHPGGDHAHHEPCDHIGHVVPAEVDRRNLIGLQILFFITVLVMAAPSRRRQS